jgi:hypothetical protein
MAIPELDPRESEPLVEATEGSRDGWLSLAMSDLGGGAGALATAARGGLLPRREDPEG